MKNILLTLTLLLFLLISLYYTKTLHQTPSYTFYHWKSSYDVNATIAHPPQYIKILDINYRKKLEIIPTQMHTQAHKGFIPVIYIDNNVFKHLTVTQMLTHVQKHLNQFSNIPFDEIQIDCDWSLKTKKRYFSFLKKLKHQSKKNISVTIRLHQVKYYQKSGVPPVDSGVLMYYNMSDFKDIRTKNYILDLDVAKRYHHNFQNYPLKLNLALPLYAQATVIRFSKVVGLIEGVRTDALTGTLANTINSNFHLIKEHSYKVKKTHYFKGNLLYQGDIIRFDFVSNEMLQDSISSLKKIMPVVEKIIFYRWENKDYYSEQTLSELTNNW